MLVNDRVSRKIPHYDVTAGLITKNNKILITQRLFNDRFSGLWEFPGGKRRSDETLAQCLARELDEELNIKIQVDKKVLSLTHRYEHAEITLHVFKCTLVDDTLQPKQVQDWKWVEFAELDQYEFTAADQTVIHKLKDIYKTLKISSDNKTATDKMSHR